MADRIKSPLTKGVAKVPVVMQLEALECGAACLCMVLAYYDKWIPIEKMRSDCGVSRDGSNALNILKAARSYDMKAQGLRMEPEDLKKNGRFPCIIHWNFNHFVVLDGFRNDKAYLNDPARGNYSVPMDVFDESFTGVCLSFEPAENFVPSGKRRSVLPFAAKRLKGAGAAVIFTSLTGIAAALLNMINPAFSRIFLDRLLTGRNPEWLTWFIAALTGINIIQIVLTVLLDLYNQKINGKITVVGSTTYMWKVLHMPMAFFSQRMAGDIQSRQDSNASIANTIINTVAPMFLNAFMTVFYLVVMLRYSAILTAVGLATLALSGVISNYMSKKRSNITRVSMRDSAMLSSSTVMGIEMIETIKASGAENGYLAKWAGHQANVNTQNVKAIKLDGYFGIISELVSTLANDAILVLGVWFAMRGEFTVGMVMAFQGFMNSFMRPVQTFISAGRTMQEMRTQMERIEDVMEYPSDDIFAPEDDLQATDGKLSGKVEIKNISFGYSPLKEPLIKDFSLSITPGETVAIVGSSGCGKSTVSKLISGLYRPWSGEILFDGKPLREIRGSVFRGSMAVVDQDIILFEDTIANNIKMWDESIEDFEMILAARDAQIHDDIMSRSDGYGHRLLEGGKDFSGGQRQRIEIARVLAQDPTIIILDEATSALDAKTEYDVVKAIRKRGITCIIIAHRLSTVRSADEIIVMDKGVIVQRGTHSELMKSDSLYKELVSAQ